VLSNFIAEAFGTSYLGRGADGALKSYNIDILFFLAVFL
jgi:hypothetical protein